MAQYPFCRLTGPANVLVMPAFHSASISTKMLQELGGATVIGPLIVGLDKPIQIVSLGATDSDLVNMAVLAAYQRRRVTTPGHLPCHHRACPGDLDAKCSSDRDGHTRISAVALSGH